VGDIDGLLALRRDNTLSSLLAGKLESYILSGQLLAGERINEAVLARELGVSRGPIREAARLLASQGLVEFVANKGAFVRQISREELLDIYELRSVLTGYACGLAARHAQGDAPHLERLHEQMSDAAGAGDSARYYQLNLKFHEQLVHLARSSRLSAMLDGLVKEQHLFRQASLTRHPDMAQSNAEHRGLVDAIVAGDAAEARRLGEAHVRAGRERFEAATIGAARHD